MQEVYQEGVETTMPTKPERHEQRWTDHEKDLLSFWWGTFSLHTIAKRLRRTTWGVSQMAKALKLGPFSKGTISMEHFEKLSGFSRPKIHATAKALGLRLDRVVKSEPRPARKARPFAITEDQQEVLLEHMLKNPIFHTNKPGNRKTTQGAWGVGWKPAACEGCNRNDIPHYAKGRCSTCHRRLLRNKDMLGPIYKFNFKYRFLSNFHPSQIRYEGALYFSVEHAYQAAKTLDLDKRKALQVSHGTELSWNPGKARAWGRRVELRPDWEDVKLDIMEKLLRRKFADPDLRRQLLATGDRELIEGNTWGDRFWGQCEAEGILSGDNNLGKLLMKIRSDLRG